MVEEYFGLPLYSGDDCEITDKVIVTQPTLRQIKNFGEKEYWSAIRTLTSVGADMKFQLWDMGIDYTKIADYELFLKFTWHLLGSRKKHYAEIVNNPEKHRNELENLSEDGLNAMLKNPLELVLKDLDLADFTLCQLKDSGEIVLYDVEKDVVIDPKVFSDIVAVVRKIHGFKRNNRLPGNEATKMILIEDDREDAMMSMGKPYESLLAPMVSALTVWTGRCGDNDKIMDMKIGMFLDNFKRIHKIMDADHLMAGAYSGFASLNDVDKDRLDWAGKIG